MFSQGICFDLDGTLIDSGPGGFVQLRKVVKKLNLPMNPQIEARLRTMWGQHPAKLIQSVWPNADVGQFYKEWEELDMAQPFPVFPETYDVLSDLFINHFYLSILTSRNLKTAIAQLRHNNILHLFGKIIAGNSGPHKKPDPRSIEPIFDKYRDFHIDPKKTIFVGDTVEGDWKLAQAVGIEFFAVLSGGMDSYDKFVSAGVPKDHIIDSVADLPRILIKN